MGQEMQGKVAIVTGAGRGIGQAIAERFAAEGAAVLVADIDREVAEAVVSHIVSQGGNAVAQVTDVRNRVDIVSMFDKAEAALGPIDILVNNAGIGGINQPLWDLPVDELDRVYAINLRGVFIFCKSVIPLMLKHKYGRIVNIASIAGKEGNPNAVPYSATKSAVIGLTKSLGKELAKTEIRVNCVTPAVVKTSILDEFTEEHINYMLEKIPIGRTGKIEEVANMVAWIASEECSFSTGAVFDISGGRATY